MNSISTKIQYHKYITVVLRVLVGATFLFSGFVKGVDPIGTAIKLHDYFIGLNIPYLNPSTSPLGGEFIISFALLIAMILAATEFTLGATIAMGIYRKASSRILLAIMLIMTPLTLYLAVADPIPDCGCFGEAIIISNWATLYKNVVLLAASIYLLIYNRLYKGVFGMLLRWMPLCYTLVLIVGIMVVSLRHQPILDFRPYKRGLNVKEALQASSVAPTYSFIYEKEGVEKEFSLENYPANDTSWHFVDRVEQISHNEIEPLDFSILQDGEEITEFILEDSTYTFLIFIPNPASYNNSWQYKIYELYDYARKFNYNIYAITSDTNEWQKEMEKQGIEYPCYEMDEIVIKTIVRGNPAVALLKDGTIYWKTSPRDLDHLVNQNKPLDDSRYGVIKPYSHTPVAIFVGLLYILPILLLWGVSNRVKRYLNKRNRDKQ